MNTLKTILILGTSLLGACASSDKTPLELPKTTLAIPIAPNAEKVSCDKLVLEDTTLSLHRAAGLEDYFPGAETMNPVLAEYQDNVLNESVFSSPARTEHPFSDCVESVRSSNDAGGTRALISNECSNLNEYRETSTTLTDSRRFDNGDEFVTILSDYDNVLEEIETNHSYQIQTTVNGDLLTMNEKAIFDRATPYYETPDASAPANGTRTFSLENAQGENVTMTLNLSDAFNLDTDVSCEFSQAATMMASSDGIEIYSEPEGQTILCNKAELEASALTCITE